MTDTTNMNTNPFDDPPTILATFPVRDGKEETQEHDLEKPEAGPVSIPERSTNPFDDPALLLTAAAASSAATSEDTTDSVTAGTDFEGLPSLQSQDKSNKPYINPFDDEDLNHGADQQHQHQQQHQRRPEQGSQLPMGDDHRDRYEHDEEEDSVKSMLEMMEHKQNYRNTPSHRHIIESLRNKARDSLAKWRWTSVGGGRDVTINEISDDEDDIYFDDDESYDCIALSSLRNKGNSSGAASGVPSDRRKMFLPPDVDADHPDDRSKSSDGTHTTKNTNGTVSNRSQSRKSLLAPRRRKYVFLVASFLALILLLGIVVLSYSLYALRNDDTQGLSIFTREFWTEDVPDKLLFWRDNDDDEGGVVGGHRLDEGPVH